MNSDLNLHCMGIPRTTEGTTEQHCAVMELERVSECIHANKRIMGCADVVSFHTCERKKLQRFGVHSMLR